MMKKASLQRGRQRNGSILGLCWINNAHHPLLSLLLLSSFGVLVAFVATGGIVAIWHHCHHLHHCHHRCFRCCRCHHCCLAVVAVISIVPIVAIIAVVTTDAVTLFAPVAVALAAVVIPLTVVTTTVLAIATALFPS